MFNFGQGWALSQTAIFQRWLGFSAKPVTGNVSGVYSASFKACRIKKVLIELIQT